MVSRMWSVKDWGVGGNCGKAGRRAWQADFWDSIATVHVAYWDFPLSWDSVATTKETETVIPLRDSGAISNLSNLPESSFPPPGMQINPYLLGCPEHKSLALNKSLLKGVRVICLVNRGTSDGLGTPCVPLSTVNVFYPR